MRSAFYSIVFRIDSLITAKGEIPFLLQNSKNFVCSSVSFVETACRPLYTYGRSNLKAKLYTNLLISKNDLDS